MRGSGKPPASSGKQPGPWPRPPVTIPGSSGYTPEYTDYGGGYGGGGGGFDRNLPDWWYGLVTWRF